jgi:hypothetical protein
MVLGQTALGSRPLGASVVSGGVPVGASVGVPFVVRTPIGASRTAPYVVGIALGTSRTAPYVVRLVLGTSCTGPYVVRTALGASRASPYVVTTSVGSSRSSPYALTQLAAASRSAPYVVRTILGASRSVPYAVIAYLGASRSTPFSVIAFVGASRSTPYVVRSVLGTSRTTPFVVVAYLGASRATPYTVTTLLGSSRSTPYVVPGAIGTSRSVLYIVRTASGASRTAPYTVTVLLGASRSAPYMVASILGASRSTPYVTTTQRGKPLALPYTITVALGASRAVPYVLATLLGSSRSVLYTVRMYLGVSVAVAYSVGLQVVRPDGDLSTGTWHVAPLYPKVDELLADDSDYIESALDPVNDTCRLSLTNGYDPFISTGHKLRFRARKDQPDASAVTLTARLKQGATTIRQVQVSVPDAWTTYEFTLTGAEADAITDYNALEVELVASGPSFLPTDLSGLAIWFDASQLGLADGAAVNPWPNLANAALPGTMTSGLPAVVRANAVKGQPVVRFTVSEARMRMLGMGVNLDYTLAYVARIVGTPGRIVTAQYPPYNFLLGFWNGNKDVAYDQGFYSPSSTGVTVVTGEWKLYSADGNSASYLPRLFSDGALLGTGGGGTGWGGTFNISGYDPSTSAESCDCEVAEVLLYNRQLSDADRQQVEAYLRGKWMT